jgi:hypothetical protein
MEEDLAFLEHFGIRGMRWGHRKPGEISSPRQRQSIAIAPRPQGQRIVNSPINNITPQQNKQNKKTMSMKQSLVVGAAITGTLLLHEAGMPFPKIPSPVPAVKAIVKGYGKFTIWYLNKIQQM